MTDSAEHNPAATKLRAGLVAGPDEAAWLGPAIGSCPELQLAAQAGVPETAALPEIRWFDDRRAMLAQGDIQLAVLSGSPRGMVELGQLALEYKQHVWRLPPLGRDFNEAVDVVRTAREAERLFRVASWWEAVQEPVRAAVKKADCLKPSFSEIFLNAAGPALSSWRASTQDAGGGVLLDDCYPFLEALIGLRGIPESVFGLTGTLRRAKSVARETEDVGLALFRFDGGHNTLVRAAWDISPAIARLRLFGQAATVSLTAAEIETQTPDGEVLDRQPLATDHLSADLGLFAKAAVTGAELPANTLDRHLAVSATIHAVYLSAKTGQPEIPRRLYEVQKWLMPT